MKLRHIMIRVYDINKSLDFYKNVLGLKVIKVRKLKDAELHFMAEKDGDPTIALCFNYHHPEKYSQGSHFGHISFEVKSMEDFTSHIKNLNIEYDRKPYVTDDGFILGFLKDPDNHSIELVEVL